MSTQTIPTKLEETFKPARRINQALTASLEKHVLEWMASNAPQWLSSDQPTALGLLAQIGAGAAYAVSRHYRDALWLVIVCLILNWFGDSMDGTLARVRSQQRPRYGFYVDHMVDIIGAIALMCGLGFSGFAHWQVAMAMLVGFLMLASESYLATYTLSHFQLSQGPFGPTEIRILLILGNLALLRSPYSTLLAHKMLLFDLCGVIAAIAMFGTAVLITVHHAAQLYRDEPLP
jgi:archaetidylinositol phosphate synthase